MNALTKPISRPTLSLPFGHSRPMPSHPVPGATLSRKELQRIVIAMLG